MNRIRNKEIFKSKIGNLLEEKNISYSFIQDTSFQYTKINGLVSAFAAWSGGTFAISQVFIEKLSDKLAKTEIPFYILDIDYVSNEIQLELFKSVKWGYFESCWLEHGEIKSQYLSLIHI